MDEWYLDTILEQKFPKFSSATIVGIKQVNYYIDYNEFYEEISYVKIKFIFEYENKENILNILFKDIADLSLNSFGESYNQLLGFKISKLDSSFDTQRKYHLEDYENNSIDFYFKELEIVSVN
ncbi:TPA_asm: hypothetical protein GIN74_13815 [Listeria monocytogenes]|uniref:hypothetical protein n=1 Tax=Listeria monocytogenes TaxID=1639 RepID=UPI000A1D5892|nr:hypothetical protein [Listeria monocytogenes]ARM72122.1 hypothetical protein LMxysn_0487 [Listeria monocytogenes]HAB0010457.1 hypothetical protein [Listeria monocytogenes]